MFQLTDPRVDAFNQFWFGEVRPRWFAFEVTMGVAVSVVRRTLPWLMASVTLMVVVALAAILGGNVLLGSELPGVGLYLGLLVIAVLIGAQMLIGLQYLVQRTLPH